MSIKYSVIPSNPHAHLFTVRCQINIRGKENLVFSLPAWIPGSYMIRDFARNITRISVTSNNKPVNLNKLDKMTWQCEGIEGKIIIEYQVYAWDLSVRSAHLDATHGFFNGTSMFVMPHGFEQQHVILELEAPQPGEYQDWQVATTLTPVSINSSGYGEYCATNYDELIDHPVEMGTHTVFSFDVANIKHEMAITGIHNADTSRLQSDLARICLQQISVFGELPTINKYLFLVMAVGNGYGGLEHRSSTSLLCSRNDLPQKGHPEEPEENYRNFLGLCSHEYFHTWNVKRIKPAAYLPYDLSQEVYTKQLWAFEGITSYYDELALVRSGVIGIESYLELLAQTITRVLRGKGRLLQSVADSSFDAWTKFYKQDENAPNSIVSYYAKGTLIALSLDLIIRDKTSNKQSLDDVMRYLWDNYGKKETGLAEGEIEQLISTLTGINLSDFFNAYVYGVEDLPLASYFATVGITMTMLPTTSVDDKGGKKPNSSGTATVDFGARIGKHDAGAQLLQVFSNQSAENAGLSAGDVVIAINNLQVDKTNFDKTISQFSPGDNIKVHAFRRDELMQFTLTLLAAEKTTCYLSVNENMSEEVKKSHSGWLQLDK